MRLVARCGQQTRTHLIATFTVVTVNAMLESRSGIGSWRCRLNFLKDAIPHAVAQFDPTRFKFCLRPIARARRIAFRSVL